MTTPHEMRRRREAAGLTLDELAARVRVSALCSATMLGRAERGFAPLRPDVAEAVDRVLSEALAWRLAAAAEALVPEGDQS